MAVEFQSLLDGNIVVSEHLKEWMVNRGADPQRVFVCHINVDPERWRPDCEARARVRRELEIDDETPILLYAGRICDQKQPRMFAQVMLRLAREGRFFRTLVAGDGPDLEWLRSFLKAHRLQDKVRLLGAVPSEKMPELMAAADVFFLPSKWEGISLAIYEAMACGLPIVGANVGGQRELVTSECGVLIPRGDEEDEAKAYTATLLLLLQENDRCREMGRAARKRIEQYFRLESMGDRMDNLLCLIQEGHRSSPRVAPSPELGQVCAAQAIEYVRLSEVVDGLWRDRGQAERLQIPPHLLDPQSDSWRTLAYFALRRLLLPYYRAALNRNMRWLPRVKSGLKRLLLREG